MKSGILTFHKSRNYGAIFQAYALCTVMNDLNIDTYIVDYQCIEIENKLKLWEFNKNVLNSILQFIFRYRKKLAFESFEKFYLRKSEISIDREEIISVLNQYDAIVVGSDQVWNEQIIGNDSTYFLNDVRARKIAYAASAGDTIALSERAIGYIKQFDVVSVREQKLKELLISYDIKSCICCDPTILAGSDCFEQIVSPKIKETGYIFVFMIWNSPPLLNNAKKFAEAKGLKIISNKDSLEFFMHCKPEELLSWIKNAAYVFTNSFHGTVFSLLFHKKFISSICKRNGEKNIRVQELLTCLGCENNILTDEYRQVDNIIEPNYDLVDDNLQKIRENSIYYLKKAFDTEI